MSFPLQEACYLATVQCYRFAPMHHVARERHLKQCQETAMQCYTALSLNTSLAQSESTRSVYTSTDSSHTKSLQHPHLPSSPTRAHTC